MKQSQTLIDLKAARELISVESRWTTRAYARTVFGTDVSALETSAVCFCSLGALRRVTESRQDIGERITPCIRALESNLNVKDVSHFNDLHTHKEVLKLFDDTIEQLKEEAE